MGNRGLLAIVIGASFLAGTVVGPRLVSAAVSAQVRTVKTTSVFHTDLGGWCDGKEVTVDVQEYGAGTSGKHYHHAYSFGWVLEGSQVVTVDGKAAVTVRPGELMIEKPMEVSETSAAAPAKVLFVRVAEKGKPATVRVP